MATRVETANRKSALLEELRRQRAAGTEVGALSQRELTQRFGLSAQTVSVLLGQLVEEGVLYTIPRVGTFLSKPNAGEQSPFLVIREDIRPAGPASQMQAGFEERIGHLGGASWALSAAEFEVISQQVPVADGRFVFEAERLGPGVITGASDSVVSFGSGVGDLVDFDNEEGGAQAARHLLGMGHRKIAFLGLHGQRDQAGVFSWSLERERGWRREMERAGQNVRGLAFLPEMTSPVASLEQMRIGAEVAARLCRERDISAVVAVNSYAGGSLLLALRNSGRPENKWPAVLHFDATFQGSSVISCLQLPWDKVGAEAAQLLWERRVGHLTGNPVTRKITMRLLPRLTCRHDWASSSLAVDRAMMQAAAPELRTPVMV